MSATAALMDCVAKLKLSGPRNALLSFVLPSCVPFAACPLASSESPFKSQQTGPPVEPAAVETAAGTRSLAQSEGD